MAPPKLTEIAAKCKKWSEAKETAATLRRDLDKLTGHMKDKYLAYITLEEKEIADLVQWFAQHGLAPMDDSEDVKSEVDEKKAKAEQEELKAKEAAARKAADEAAAIAWEQVYTKFMAGEEGKVPDERPTQIKEEPQDEVMSNKVLGNEHSDPEPPKAFTPSGRRLYEVLQGLFPDQDLSENPNGEILVGQKSVGMVRTYDSTNVFYLNDKAVLRNNAKDRGLLVKEVLAKFEAGQLIEPKEWPSTFQDWAYAFHDPENPVYPQGDGMAAGDSMGLPARRHPYLCYADAHMRKGCPLGDTCRYRAADLTEQELIAIITKGGMSGRHWVTRYGQTWIERRNEVAYPAHRGLPIAPPEPVGTDALALAAYRKYLTTKLPPGRVAQEIPGYVASARSGRAVRGDAHGRGGVVRRRDRGGILRGRGGGLMPPGHLPDRSCGWPYGPGRR